MSMPSCTESSRWQSSWAAVETAANRLKSKTDVFGTYCCTGLLLGGRIAMTAVLALYVALSPAILWPYVLGIVLFLLGLLAIRSDLSQADGSDKVLVLGRLC